MRGVCVLVDCGVRGSCEERQREVVGGLPRSDESNNNDRQTIMK